MRIVDVLREEHRLIERVAGSLVAFVEDAKALSDRAEVLASFCTFFASYADARHHAMEEDVLFRALRDVELPEQGPIAALRAEHASNREAIAAIRATEDLDDPELGARARGYCAHLWEHIDKEDSVLFPEVEVRLVLEGERLDRELAAFEARADARPLVALGESLVRRFPPRAALPGVFRGEGCSVCRHFGDRCQGIEREWWSELEWEAFRSRDF
jgi:hemerythrin-like domain-containing protein